MGNTSLEVIDPATIRDLRIQKGRTITELATDAGLSRAYLCMIEGGKRRRLTKPRADALAKALGVKRSEIIRVVA